MSEVRPVARQRDDGSVGLADLEDVAAGDADGAEAAGAAARDVPLLHLAGLLVGDLHLPPHVRVHPEHARELALDRLALVLIELCLDGMMAERRQRRRRAA